MANVRFPPKACHAVAYRIVRPDELPPAENRLTHISELVRNLASLAARSCNLTFSEPIDAAALRRLW